MQYAHVAVCVSSKALHAGRGRKRQGFILYNQQATLQEPIQQVLWKLSNRCQSQHARETAALTMALLEFRAMGQDYARQVLANTRALASALQQRGFVVLGGTDKSTVNTVNAGIHLPSQQPQQQPQTSRSCTHQLVVDLEASFLLSNPGNCVGWSATAATTRLRTAAGIYVTPQELPLDNVPAGATGLRLATAVLTRRGFVETDLRAVAQAMGDLLNLGVASHSKTDSQIRRKLKEDLKERNAAYCYFSLDEGRPMVVPEEIVICPMTMDFVDLD